MIRDRLLSLTAVAAVLVLAACDLPLTSFDAESPRATLRAADVLELTPAQELGEFIFDDEDLSINRNQSCASCHGEDWGATGPDSEINAAGAVYEGSIPGSFGDRKPPSSAYATLSPILAQDKRGLWVGGNFWDGRATGEKLGNPAADQAQGPFVNPVEQALPDRACVVYRVGMASYGDLYRSVWGGNIDAINFPTDTDALCSNGSTVPLSSEDNAKVDREYDNIALAVAAYENSDDVNAFNSRFDLSKRGGSKLSKEEQRGRSLFQGKAGCAKCHTINGQQPLFTDFSYDNLGVPVNPENPAVVADPNFRDPGLGGFLMRAGYPASVYEAEWGKVKVPTLRNVDARPTPGSVKAYGHNGYFKSLWSIVHFYNTRDVKPTCADSFTEMVALAANCWPAPEISENVNRDELGDLGLTREEEEAIVEFLKTLSDGSGS